MVLRSDRRFLQRYLKVLLSLAVILMMIIGCRFTLPVNYISVIEGATSKTYGTDVWVGLITTAARNP